MKCSICGHRSNSIKGMGDHYRKKHPHRMKQRKAKGSRNPDQKTDRKMVYAILKREGLI